MEWHWLALEGPNMLKTLSKNNKVGGITLSNIKAYYVTTVIKTIQYWYKNRPIGHWDRLQSPNINPLISSQLIFDKRAKNTQWRKDSLFNKFCWENWIVTCKKMKLDPYLKLLTKINSKSIKVLHVKPKIVRLLEKSIVKKYS